MKKAIKKPKIKKETDTEMLARIMVNGFDEIKRTMATKEELAAVKRELVGEISSVKGELLSVKDDLAVVKDDVASIKEDQKEANRQLASLIKKQGGMLLSLDETVHRSEFDGLVHRVEVLEK